MHWFSRLNPLAALVFLTVTALAACSGGKAPGHKGLSAPALAAARAAPVVVRAAMNLADREAARKLEEFNKKALARKLGGPFLLRDYSRQVSPASDGTRAVFRVSYKYRHPVGFNGHPQHFSVWVYRDSGQTRFFAGR